MTAATPAPTSTVGNRAARTGLPVLLLAVCLMADLADQPPLTTGFDGDPRRHVPTATVHDDGLRAKVHAPGGPAPAQLAAAALPGAPQTTTAYLATPGQMARAVPHHHGLLARAAVWHGRTPSCTSPKTDAPACPPCA
ncbi:hypothetical protein [Kitasatospora sp. NPDC006786]|uniref:hypothetical protein n=1 Tax=unclassified Kitasatospora TaxID=2633591 RepID=UPI0033E949F8